MGVGLPFSLVCLLSYSQFVERGRSGRLLQSVPKHCPLTGSVERKGSDPQRAFVWAKRQRGQPRRGRQRTVLLPGFDTDSFLQQVPVQVPSGRGVCPRSISNSVCRDQCVCGRGQYPYAQLVDENRRRSRLDPEFELTDALHDVWTSVCFSVCLFLSLCVLTGSLCRAGTLMCLSSTPRLGPKTFSVASPHTTAARTPLRSTCSRTSCSNPISLFLCLSGVSQLTAQQTQLSQRLVVGLQASRV
jgi:hypothetical protein